jgi:hypothetical protein
LSSELAVKQANIMAAIKDMSGAKPGSTITLTKERKQREAQNAAAALKNSKPRATFSLFGLGFGAVDEGLPPPEKSPKQTIEQTRTAPQGVPTMSRWKKNPDASITGMISASRALLLD